MVFAMIVDNQYALQSLLPFTGLSSVRRQEKNPGRSLLRTKGCKRFRFGVNFEPFLLSNGVLTSHG